MLPGMSSLMSSVAGSAGGCWFAGGDGGGFPVLPLVSTTFSPTTLGGRLSGRLISARSTVRGAVTFGEVKGPAIATVPLAVATASSRAATRKLARVAVSSAVGPEGPLRTTLPCPFQVPLAVSAPENQVKVKR